MIWLNAKSRRMIAVAILYAVAIAMGVMTGISIIQIGEKLGRR